MRPGDARPRTSAPRSIGLSPSRRARCTTPCRSIPRASCTTSSPPWTTLPLVVVLWNNSSWGPSFDQMPMLKGRVDPFDMLPDLRYDRMFEAIGCHGEYVTQPDDIRPALARAMACGKPSVVNVIGDPRVGHARLGGNLLGSTQL